MKLLIDIPEEIYQMVMNTGTFGNYRFNTTKAIKNGTPLDDVKAEINNLDFGFVDEDYKAGISYAVMIFNQILDNIGKTESIDPNDLTHIFDGVTEFPKDAFKGWDTEELLKQIRAESEEKANGKIYFEVEDDVVIKYTPMSIMMGESTYTTEVVMTKEIFQECYKKWIESQESEDKE